MVRFPFAECARKIVYVFCDFYRDSQKTREFPPLRGAVEQWKREEKKTKTENKKETVVGLGAFPVHCFLFPSLLQRSWTTAARRRA